MEKKGSNNNVALIYLNRPDSLNALCDGLIHDLRVALDDAQMDKDIGAIVITGSGRAFAGRGSCVAIKLLLSQLYCNAAVFVCIFNVHMYVHHDRNYR